VTSTWQINILEFIKPAVEINVAEKKSLYCPCIGTD
jgi:hypothetical protein